MSAFVLHLQPVGADILLAHLNIVRDALAVYHVAPAAFVQAVLGVDQVAVILEQPDHAVVRAAAFLVRGQGDDQIAIRLPALALVANQVRDPDGRLRFVVDSAAPVEVAVLFGELEGIHGPIRALRLHHVEVREQQQRFALAGPVITHHDVHLVRRRAQHLNVGSGKTLGLQTLGDGLRGGCGGAGAERGVDLDQLLVNIVREAGLLGWAWNLFEVRLSRGS